MIPVPFELQPVLAGERVTLRPLAPDDFDAVFAAAGDPLIWEQHPEPDRWKREVFQRYFDGGIASGGAFAAIDPQTRRVIGSTRYCNLVPGRQVEIGWTFLERRHWGGTVNGEMKRLMIDHAHRFVPRVVFVVGEHNQRSRRALLKIGARLDASAETRRLAAAGDREVVFTIDRAARTPETGGGRTPPC